MLPAGLQGAPNCPGDLTSDGRVGFGDLVLLIAYLAGDPAVVSTVSLEGAR